MKKYFVLMICLMIFTPYYVFGLENYETTFNITIDEIPYMTQTFGETQKTYKEVYDEIISTTTNNYFMIMNTYNRSNWETRLNTLTILVVDTYPLINNSIHYMSNGTGSQFRYIQDTNLITYKYKNFGYTDLNQNTIDEIKSCISDYNNCNWSTINNLDTYLRPGWYGNIVNTNSPNIVIPNNQTNSQTTYNFPIYANYRIPRGQPTQAQIDSTTIYIKNVVVNNITIEQGMSTPTYYDLYYPSTPEPEPEPEDPENDSEFTSWIYWFSEPTDSTSVLNNIYTLLFLYCFTMIIFKVYYSIKPRK